MKVRRLNRRGKAEWVLDYYEESRRIRKWYKSRALAEAAMGALKEEHRNAGQSWIQLSPEERNDLMLVASEAQQRNVTLRAVWEAFKAGKLDAQPMQRCTLRKAIDETIEWRRGENLRERYLKELESYLRKFSLGRSEVFIDQLGVAEIQEWFGKRNEALSTRRSNIGRLGSLFDVAWKKGYVKDNPCLRLPTVKLEQEAPTILAPAEAKKVLTVARKKARGFVPYLVLGMFAGIRPEELQKLKWGDIDLKHGTATVDAAASKTNRRRVVQLHKTAVAWLKSCKAGKKTASICPPKVTLRRWRRKVRDAAGVPWEQDILRHTAGSYLLALHQNAHTVSAMLGNSAKILERHYKDLVHKSDCESFWALRPKGAR